MNRFVIILMLVISLKLNGTAQSNIHSRIDSLNDIILQKTKADTSIAKAYGTMSALYATFKMDTVETICLNGLEFIKKAKNRATNKTMPRLLELESILYTNQGYAYYHIGYLEKAIDLWYKSLSIKNFLKDKTGESRVLNNIANLEVDLGAYDKAEKTFDRILKIQQELKNTVVISRTYVNLGYLNRLQGNDSLALHNYRKALELKKLINDQAGIANCYNNIGFMFKKDSIYDKAIENYTKALTIYESVESNYGLLAVLNNLASCYYELNELNRAKKLALRGYKIAQEQKMNIDVKHLSETLYKINKKQGNLKSALKFYEDFVGIRDSLGDEKHYKALINQELQYKFEQKEKLRELEQEKELELQQIKHQNELRLEQEKSFRLMLISSVISVGLIIVILLLFYIRSQLNKVKQQRATIQHQSAELELIALRSQMNPHFLFNSLNSIKSYIIQNDPKSAAKYLNKFAKLVRAVLENSNKNLISLDEEMHMLQQYVELEKLRFPHSFEFTINTGLPLDDIQIPPLVLQPYVENSIWHGLRNKATNGKIEINILEIESGIVIAIRDNGVGRQASQISGNKSSMGMGITEKRLQQMFKLVRANPQIEVIDIKDKQGNALGTEVKITIQYEE